ncbi:cytochrome P450 [Nemania sp. FL0916]|nr:cytochrome P450 [Nemania sp. FL0916]
MKDSIYADRPLPTVAYYGFALLISYLCLYISYYAFLHPLSKYPAPFLASLSNGYNGYYAFRRQLHSKTRQNHLKYGPVVRQGPNKLVFSSVAALRDIYRNDNTTKPQAYIALGPRLTIPTVFTAQDRQLHRTRRQLIGQALSERSMRIFEPNMLEQVDIFLRRVLKSTQTPGSAPNSINMTESARLLGFDLAALLAFGYNLHLQTRPDNSFVLPMLEAGFFWASVFIHWPLTRQFSIGLALLTVFRRLRSQYLSLVQNMISSRIKQDKHAHHDLYSIVADHLDQSKPDGIRQSELWAEATLFLPAAGDTTKTALASIFFYLSQNLRCYNNLASEIRTKFMSGREIRGSSLADCHYLRACIDEALRMSPPVPGILWREGYPDRQPFTVDGHIIPPGIIVGVNIYSVHYDEEYFPEPFNFRPERWIDDPKTTGDAFMPFSAGPRGCAGKPMAYLELSLVVAKTLWYFDFESAPDLPGETQNGGKTQTQVFELSDNFTASHDGPHLVFKQRGNLCKNFDDVYRET